MDQDKKLKPYARELHSTLGVVWLPQIVNLLDRKSLQLFSITLPSSRLALSLSSSTLLSQKGYEHIALTRTI